MKTIMSAALFCLLAGVVCAQEKAVPVGEEGHHQLVLENEYTRVFHVTLAPKESTLMHQHDRDYVYVMIGSSQVEVVKPGAAPTQMKLNDGDVKFTKGPLAHKVTNTGDTPFVNLTIEVKKASTKSVCGASWAGQVPPGTICGGSGGGTNGGASWSKVRALETDAVSADLVTSSDLFLVDTANGHPILVVALTPFTANELTTDKATIVEGKKLEAGNVFWVPANEMVNVVSGQGEPAKFVLVEFQ